MIICKKTPVSLLLTAVLFFADLCQCIDYDDLGGGEAKFCPPYRCSSGMDKVPMPHIKFKSTGCGSIGSGMMMMSAGTGEEPYAICCDQWHACYQTCGAPKQVCDGSYLSCADTICDGTVDPKKCKEDVNLKKLLINIGGCQGYDQAQHAACDCVHKDKALERRKDAIRYFYKKYAPEQLSKVDGLAAKAGGSSTKLAGLFQKLLVKYPNAIQKEKGYQQDLYDRFMKDDDGKPKTTEDNEYRAKDGEDSVYDSDETQEL